MSERPHKTRETVTLLSQILKSRDVEHAIIGAMAMAAWSYVRATVDYDIGVVTDPFGTLSSVAADIKEQGYKTELITPDDVDPLGGVLTITKRGINPIQLVNFLNPFAPRRGVVGIKAIKSAVTLPDFPIAVVDLPHLVLLKLYAGGLQSRADVVGLLKANPHTNIPALRELAEEFELRSDLDNLLPEIGYLPD